jgi:GT2 family glycosyltransferase
MTSPDLQASKPPTISLIIATRNRRKEMENFLIHLDQQTYRDIELVLVDHSDEAGIEELLHRYSFPHHYVRSSEHGLARGRNAGMPLARGKILSFPDDDCWYPPDLLQAVARWFEEHAEIDMLSVLECNPQGEPMVPKDPPPAGLCNDQPTGFFPERSVWMVQSSMLFMRSRVRDAVGSMNEDIGVGTGTKFQSGEETDYFLRAMRAGFKLWFEPSLRMFHPELRELPRIRKINYPYALGQGYLLRKYRCPIPRLLAVTCRAFGGAVVSACRFDFPYVAIYFKRAVGIFVGYFGSGFTQR